MLTQFIPYLSHLCPVIYLKSNQLINQLVQQGIAVIVISSELPEVLGLSDRVLVMHEGKLKANLVNNGLTQEQVMEAALRSERHVEKQPV